jgi:phosphate transport system protein
MAKSIQSLVMRNSELANESIDMDDYIDEAEVQIDQLCFLILAKRQPVAFDLRFITQAGKMGNDLERIADLAVNICERTLLLNKEPQLKPYEDIPVMAGIVQSMIKDAIDSFVGNDTDKAYDVIERDVKVDALYQKIIRDLLGMMTKDASAIERGIHIQSISKFLERMADHATNLAEQVIYMVNADDLRCHRGDRRKPGGENGAV